MSFQQVKAYFDSLGLGDRVQSLEQSSATVALAAEAIGCDAGQIVKTLTFLVDSRPILILMAGNVRTDNAKFKAQFHQKAAMLPAAEVEGQIGHAVGGVCPFAIHPGVAVYLDVSLKQNAVLYPAAGDAHSFVKLSLEELERYAGFTAWVDVCREA